MLTNEIRRHFGIKEIDKSWKKLAVKDLWRGHCLVDDNNVIQKLIYPIPEDEFSYREVDYDVQLNNELKIVGKRGKVQPLTAATLLKIKPEGKYFDVDETSLQLINHSNGVQLFNEYDLKWNSADDVTGFLNRKISNQDKFFSSEMDVYLTRKKPVDQRIGQGDIFRLRLANDRFAYGRVIADLKKFLTHDTGIVSEWKVDIRGRSIFNNVLVREVLVDYFMVITDSPYLSYKDLQQYKTTSAVMLHESYIKHESYIVVDNAPIDPSSFDLPMGLDTYFEYEPVCHIFKWGGCVVCFKADKKIEKLRVGAIKDAPAYAIGSNGRAAEYYIKSFIEGKPEYAFLNNREDLRGSNYKELKKLMTNYLDFDLINGDYDAFARKYGFMGRVEILDFTRGDN